MNLYINVINDNYMMNLINLLDTFEKNKKKIKKKD